MEVLQVQSELAQMVALYRAKQPTRVLEIGCWDGGTLREWLTHAAPNATVVAVDLDHRNQDEYADWLQPDTDLILGYGFSQSPEMAALIREFAPYGWVFIDGDHSPSAVRADTDLCLPLVSPGGLLLLHDIVGDPSDNGQPTGPAAVFADLQARGFETEKFVDPQPHPDRRGVGVVRL
jgi:cephalosporin hydroxylase